MGGHGGWSKSCQALRPHFFSMGGWLEGSWSGCLWGGWCLGGVGGVGGWVLGQVDDGVGWGWFGMGVVLGCEVGGFWVDGGGWVGGC